ncbi:terpene synthase family protein [Lentzea flaviverrucosa]|nr:terpene synthase family protein [Lentzea flaviverrucosa]
MAIAANRAGDWCCRIAPHAAQEQLQLISDWVHLGFLVDDRRFDGGPLVRSPERLIPMMMHLLFTLEHPETTRSDDPFVEAWRDISNRARASADPVAVRRWADGNMEWFFAVSCLLSHRVAGTMPSLDEYANLGPRDRGMRLVGSLVELAEGTTLPDSVRESGEVRAITQAAYLLVTIASDIFSFAKEAKHDVLESNTVGVIRYARKCSNHEAMARTVALHDRMMCLYLGLRRKIQLTGDTRLRQHVRQMDHLVRGNLEWSAQVPRYRNRTERPVSAVSDAPRDAHLTAPPDMPSISWWWNHLGDDAGTSAAQIDTGT